jgi:bifunctional UDP-N-acetylglucosamine pyrophosphorylase / glucosamine-1-phosphate N-acetyltransferase
MSEHQHETSDPAAAVRHDVAVAVLAAGHGSRMRSDIPKHLHRVAGVPIVERVIRAALGSGAGRTLVMVGSNLADLEDRIGTGGYELVVQGPPKGTADSVRQALERAPDARWMISLLGDNPLLTPEIVKALLHHAEETGSRLTLLTCIVPDAASYGRIDRDEHHRVRRIIERKNDDVDLRQGPTEINSGVMVLDAAWARRELALLPEDPVTGEFLLTDLVEIAVSQALADGAWPVAAHIADESVSLGVNDRAELASADARARQLKLARLMEAGVTFIGGNTTFVDEDVAIGADSIVHPHTILRGRTTIGAGCEIGPAAVLTDARVGNGVTIAQSTITDSEVGNRSDVGPYAHLRKGCRVGAGVHVGSYVEMKNATLADGAKCGHVSYLGDVSVGADANIGAGTIVANFDGVGKHPTVIGDGAFIGSDSVLVAPVTIGQRARTGAGSVVTRDVPDDTTVLGVPARRKPVPVTAISEE